MARSSTTPNRYSKLVGAIENRAELFENGKFSLTPEDGAAVILTSGETAEDKEVLAEHAEALREDRTRPFYGAHVVAQTQRSDILDAIQDPEIASIAFLGDGNFGVFNILDREGNYQRISWDWIARNTTHLKLGSTSERTCTQILNPNREVRVALSSFLVADQTAIEGTVDMTFGNHIGFEGFNEHLGQIYNHPTNDAESLRRPGSFVLAS